MICPRCSHWNVEDEHRCSKCATRLTDRLVESAFYSHGSLALQVKPEIRSSSVAAVDPAVSSRAEDEPSSKLRTPRFAFALQQSLFAMRDGEKVVSIDGLAEPKRVVRKTAARRKTVSSSYLPQQGVLEFVPQTGPAPRLLSTAVEARIFCEYPVASVAHRMIAAVYDLGIVAGMAIIFLGLLFWGCDGLVTALQDPICLSVIAAAVLLLGLTFESAFLLCRGETPGMKFAKLRLVDFDGRPTSEAHLSRRMLGYLVSVLPLGLGLGWALLDEEGLSWQDHISQSFPTPIKAD